MSQRHEQMKRMQNYVFGLVSVIGLFFLSFPLAYWRVSRSENYAGLPMKSLKQEDSQKPKLAEKQIPETANKEVQVVSLQPMAVAQTINQQLTPEEQNALQADLYEKIDKNWQTYPTFSHSLPYYVYVNKKGEITGFKPLNQAAKTDLHQIPLSDLVQSDLQQQISTPHNRFMVIFHTNGVLEVNP
jgi:hypothetical protein